MHIPDMAKRTAGTRPRSRAIAARKAKGLTQEDLAAAIGIDQSLVSRLENGHSQPLSEVAVRIADALGITVAELLEREPAADDDDCDRTGTEG